MKAIIDTIECQRDSPRFRQVLEENEKDLDILEGKLEKVVKQCNQMVTAGKQFTHEQEQLIYTLWDLAGYFSDDTPVQSALNRMLTALGEAAKYHAILVDQAARTVTKNLANFIKNELRGVKDLRHYFEKVSGELDSTLQRASSVSRTRTHEADEMSNLVLATRRAFRHTTVDYVHTISVAQGRKRHEVIDAIMSYLKAYSTFYHQGTDLCDDLKPSLDTISKEVSSMRQEVSELEKFMENRHTDVTDHDILVPSSDADQPVTMHGYLFKRTTNAFKTWNRRYFTLQNNQLVYRKRSGEEVTVMEEDLRLCTVKPAMEVDRRFCFEVVSPMKCHMLQAESEESYDMWIGALQKGISQALQLGQHDKTPNHCDPFSSLLLPPRGALTPSSPGDSPISASPATTPQATVAGRTQLMQEIMQVPGNDCCCDCGTNNPKWASINLGITLCIECSGIHRSLGVHYSKVRSLTLDAWEPEVVKVMLEMGNSVVNNIYLATYAPGGDAGLAMLKPDSQRSVREEWIKAKYVQRRFVRPLPATTASLPASPCGSKRSWRVPRRRRRNRRSVVVESPATPTLPHSHSLPSTVVCEAGDVVVFNVDSPGSQPDSLDLSAASDDNSTDGEDTSDSAEHPLDTLSPDMLLYRACESHNLAIMSQSLALGANKNWHNDDDKARTPMHQAVLSGSTMALEFLLVNGARPNEKDAEGRTPLHLAALHSNIGQVCLLLKHRVDLNVEDGSGHKAIHLALEINEPDIVTLLRVADMSEDIDRDGGCEDNNMLSDVLRDFQEKKVNQGHYRARHNNTSGVLASPKE